MRAKGGAHNGRSESVVVVVSLSATRYGRAATDEQVVASGRRRAGRSGMKPFCQSVRLPLAVSAGERRQQQQVVQIVVVVPVGRSGLA